MASVSGARIDSEASWGCSDGLSSAVARHRPEVSWSDGGPALVGATDEGAGGDAIRGTVLVVDDDPATLRMLTRVLGRRGHTVVTAADGDSALAAIARHRPDVILLDVVLPGMDGFDVCRRVKNDLSTRLTPVVLVTGLNSTRARVRGIEAGADEFLSKPFDVCELDARVQSLVRLKRYTDELESAESVIISLALTVEARDAYTQGHSQRLSAYAVEVGRAFGLDETKLAALGKGGYLHDIGKIGIPDSVLLKPGALTDAEFAIIKRHTVIGEQLCGTLRSLSSVRPIIRSHHERLDGSGYPDGLRGDAIPLIAQIVSVVDIYDAITTTRSYRAARSETEACTELAHEAARGAVSRRVVAAVAALVDRGRFARIAAAVQIGASAAPGDPRSGARPGLRSFWGATRVEPQEATC